MKKLASCLPNVAVVLAFSLAAIGCTAAGAPESASDPSDASPDRGASKLPTIAEKVDGARLVEGLLDVHLDEANGKVWLELPATGEDGVLGEYIYLEGLATGLGSNPVGLDRGQLGGERLVEFRRHGNRVLLIQPNLSFRAFSENPLEVQSVREAFAESVLWGGEIAAAEGDRILVDLTDFVVRDAHGTIERLKWTDQGSFQLDRDRSAVRFDGCFAFPENVELEAVLTFTSSEPGAHVRSTAPDPRAVTLVQHHSFVALPPPGYEPRVLDPRSGYFGIGFQDYAAALDEPLEVRWLARHRLEKTDPEAASSPVEEPIVYYLDPGTPEPVRSALLDGARWWGDAFEKAGFQDAYRVEMLPEGAHPLDVRYNVIQWVHRSTRGWSYGNSVFDPRTGEIIKGHVSLGSLRVRQDIRIFEGLLGTAKTGSGAADDPVELSLARIRQLSAHEVGHTLGLAHNFAASTYDRASVMDYPAPLVRVRPDGTLDVSEAYGVGVGEWDVHAIRYGYSQFPEGADVEAELEAMVRDAAERGLLYVTDRDARPPGAAHPYGSLWDNGTEPVSALEDVLEVRRVALESFGPENVKEGEPLALLQETLAPIYFYHRYQVDATAKMLAGMTYPYALRGDAREPAAPIPAEEQRRALTALLDAIEPETLDLPDELQALLLPRPPSYAPNRELFSGRTDPAFDGLEASATATRMVLENVLQPERLTRMVDFHRRDPTLPSLEEVLTRLRDMLLSPRDLEPRLEEIRRLQQRVYADRLVEIASDADVSPLVRSRVEGEILDVRDLLRARPGRGDAERSHRLVLGNDLTRFLEEREWEPSQVGEPLPPPPGSPIGSEASWDASFGSDPVSGNGLGD